MSFRNRHKISIILKAKFGANFVTSFYRRKTSKLDKIIITKFYRMTSSVLLRKFRVIALKFSMLLSIRNVKFIIKMRFLPCLSPLFVFYS